MKICCVFNYPSHYRESIYKYLDERFNCDFFFGDRLEGKIKSMPVTTLDGYKATFKVKIFSNGYKWCSQIKQIFSSEYTIFLITGDLSYSINWLLLIYAKLRGVKIYTWSHAIKGNLSFLKRIYYKLFFGNMTGIFLYGNNTKRNMISLGYASEKLHVVYNSLSYDSQLKIRQHISEDSIFCEHFHNGYPVLSFIGRLICDKKLEHILSVQSSLKEQGIYVNVVFIGDGEDRANLEQEVKKRQLENMVWFYGASYNENENANLLFNSWLTVSPGNIGLTAIHSMMYGTPVITHDNYINHGPEYEAIQEGITGSFFKEDCLQDLEAKIVHWIGMLKENREIYRGLCYQMIDRYYNPHFQMQVFESVFNGSE